MAANGEGRERERRRLFKEAYAQLLSAIKTQISEDDSEQIEHTHTHIQAQHRPQCTHPVVCH